VPRPSRSVPALIAATMFGCDAPAALADFPADTGGRPVGIVVMRPADCDGNLASLAAFEAPRIRSGLVLAGVILVEGDSAEPRLRDQLRAYDVVAPVLHLAAATRDSIGTLTRGLGPAIVVYDRARNQMLVMPTPQSPRGLLAFTDTLTSIAARPRVR